MNICFISGSYPTPAMPQHGVFLQQTAMAMAACGHSCTIISPLAINKYKQSGLTELAYREKTTDSIEITVLRPRFLSLSNKQLGFFNTARLTQHNFEQIVHKTLKNLPVRPDILYGLFMFPGGGTAARYGHELAIPAVVEVGEGVFWTLKPFDSAWVKKRLALAAAFRPLGAHLKRALMADVAIPEEKIRVIPNGVNRREFRPGDQLSARRQQGLPPNKFIVLFVGTFNENKGGRELLAAVEQIPECYLVMIGSGPLKFSSPQLLFQGLVKHEELPAWYQAADIFALPTRVEGSCNAAIEAMGCGLPLVTSNGEHMADIAGPENALTVDEKNVEAIKEAILKLKNDSALRETLRQGALKKAEQFAIDNRARELTAWFNTLVNRHE